MKVVLFILTLIWVVLPCSAFAASHQHAVSQHQAVPKVKHTSKLHKPTKRTAHHVKSVNKKVAHKKNQHKKITRNKKVNKVAAIPNDRRNESETVNIPEIKPAVGFFASMEHRLVNFVHNVVHTLRYSSYKLGGTNFDLDRGVYIVDCSDYVDRILENVYPEAYFDLLNNTGTDKPTTAHYFDFFSGLSDEPNRYWNRVSDVEELKAGDILVFRYKNSVGRMGSGHVMVVMDKPMRDDDVYFVRVSDSATSGHSADTRPRRVSGIGIGTLMLRARPDGQPSAYAWKVGSRWKSNVRIAMARPVGVS